MAHWLETGQETTMEIKLTFCLAHHIHRAKIVTMKIWRTFEVSGRINLYIKYVLKCNASSYIKV